jgi:competence protein ComEA
MRRFLSNYFTQGEQRVLLTFVIIGIITLLANQTFVQKVYAQEVAADSSLVELQNDYVVKIDIRTASLEEICQIKGIGPKTAQKIIDYREAKSFESVEDLLQIKGIGKKTLERIKPNLILLVADSLRCNNQISRHNSSAIVNNESQTNINKTNINNASERDLCVVKGIGKKRAQQIIELRKQLGSFSSFDEILEIKGIGKKTLAKIEEKFFIGKK